MPAQSLDLLRGTFDLLILKSLNAGPAHGSTIAQWIERPTDDLRLVRALVGAIEAPVPAAARAR